ncbi:MAG: ACT domain-containing protein [Planctomycetes bacterium]|nr:ACT domain-containing protein [Planctomycetota bacterium]
MKIRQISVFIENAAGRLYAVTKALADGKVNIRALSLADTADFGVLRMVVDDVDRAVKTLKAADHTVGITEVIAVEVPDQPGGLASVLAIFSEEAINVEYMYAFVEKSRDHAVMVFRIEGIERAIQLLEKRGLRLLSTGEVVSL